MDHRVDPLPASERILTLDVVLKPQKSRGPQSAALLASFRRGTRR